MTDGPHLDPFNAFVFVMTHAGTKLDETRKALQVHRGKNKTLDSHRKQQTGMTQQNAQV